MTDNNCIISQQPTANSQQPTANLLLSVIIISYNESEYLPQALESVLSQNFDDYEIIIGDDGSNDGSIELIKEYCMKYPGKIQYFVMDRPENDKDIIPSLRVSNVIKTALTKARGKFISVLSGDDYFCSNNKFSDAVNFLNSHDKYSAYVSGYKKVYPDGNEIDCRCPRPHSFYWFGFFIHASSLIFRKSVFDEGFFLKRLFDDTGLTFSTACAGKWKFSDDITFAYRQRENSIMSSTTNIETAIVQLMLFQDCLCSGKMRWRIYSRFHPALNVVYENRKALQNASYAKYLANCENYDNNVLKEIAEYDSSIKSRIFVINMRIKCKILRLFFKCAFLPFRIIRKCKKIILSRS